MTRAQPHEMTTITDRSKSVVPLRVPVRFPPVPTPPPVIEPQPEPEVVELPVLLDASVLRGEAALLATVEEFLRDLSDRIEEMVVSRVEEELQRLHKTAEQLLDISRELQRFVRPGPFEAAAAPLSSQDEPAPPSDVERAWMTALR